MRNKQEELEDKGEDPGIATIGETYASELINQRTGFPQFGVLKDAAKKKIETNPGGD
jgi:hypothetical protein